MRTRDRAYRRQPDPRPAGVAVARIKSSIVSPFEDGLSDPAHPEFVHRQQMLLGNLSMAGHKSGA
jgi:hypothetical protein